MNSFLFQNSVLSKILMNVWKKQTIAQETTLRFAATRTEVLCVLAETVILVMESCALVSSIPVSFS